MARALENLKYIKFVIYWKNILKILMLKINNNYLKWIHNKYNNIFIKYLINLNN